MTVIESLRKNARFLGSGIFSAVALLLVWRAVNGAPLIQPQSDFGIVLGALAVTAYVVIQDLRESNGKSS
ncbi:hypothetical protein SAMN06265338_101566 [Rhodoblastus acidophilus]|uniref:Uncharacterized protein n=1 Tax=Rhodoblastus acidophilus TaxID=1074 RepID=A0A212QFW1_RHOAC|nr:hypothetical protein [Rhodoblastus acidophilus]MCW2316386.1 hypothetical protein [Rhodoblastus acidophilus]PPQ40017.1 hypothetical protein CKO16_04250 [Rhodoblastus acidophilus]RAI22340.1 hypothetical protein CH337_05745 [Rhodoblastus acidophilus]SNB58216.1 hypothetical protein SAMN06265338_101566 [Rhodoblastus acidophilus]